MNVAIQSEKLRIPSVRSNMIMRTRLFELMDEGSNGKMTMVSASAGYGKTTLVSQWLAHCTYQAAWLSLDEHDNDPIRFIQYLMATFKKVAGDDSQELRNAWHYQPTLPISYVLNALLHDISTCAEPVILVLDDYHVIESQAVHVALGFLIDNQPGNMHVILITREDPPLPLARMRARNELVEVRGNDLRFTECETAQFFNQRMNLHLSPKDIETLEKRTEGWVAGLHLAAISMRNRTDRSAFISSFTGSHRFVMDYLMEEVLSQQSEKVQDFLLQTSILDRFCGSLCDAMLRRDKEGEEILVFLERSNLFVIPLDDERQWYRYHHLFSDLLRQRYAYFFRGREEETSALHIRASKWLEEHGFDIEAFQHATAAQDMERAVRLIEGDGMPLHFRGGARIILSWLEKQGTSLFAAHPSLHVFYASARLMTGKLNEVEQHVSDAEALLLDGELDDSSKDLIGHIASIRATLGAVRNDVDSIIEQAHIALKHLHPSNHPVRAATIWTQGVAYQLKGERTAARRAYAEAILIGRPIGHLIITLMATLGTGQLEEQDNQLKLAMQTYRQVIELAGTPPLPAACDAFLGISRIFYEWNDLQAAELHMQQGMLLVRQLENTDKMLECELLAAKIKLAGNDLLSSEELVLKADQSIQEQAYSHLVEEVALLKLNLSLYRDESQNEWNMPAVHGSGILQARIYLIQGNVEAAVALLNVLYDRAKVKQQKNEQLRLLVLLAIAFQQKGELKTALHKMNEAIRMAKRDNFVRLFVNEGKPMLDLVTQAAARRIQLDYTKFLITHLREESQLRNLLPDSSNPALPKFSVEPLTERELEVLQLIAAGLSNQQIANRLFLALSTVKGYNRSIFEKLQVKRRTEAIARAREVGLL